MLTVFPVVGFAQDVPTRDRPALLQADEVTYQEDLRIVTARGNVEVAQGERILQADTLSYNLKTDVITAHGNVALLEPDGTVVFASYVQLTGDLREGAIRSLRTLLTDRSRIAAASGQRTGGNRTEMWRAVFSPCELCEEDPTRPPLWQIKAVQIIHDKDAQVIQYRDAWLEMFGVPVAYTPFFQHPDPTVERQSGFLSPTFLSSEETLGFGIQLPYYLAISDSVDATIEPIFTEKKTPVFAGQYRQHFGNGRLELHGSATIQDHEVARNRVKKNDLRGHIDATGRFDIDKTWRWGLDLERTSDDTYIKLYDFPNIGPDFPSSRRTLTTNAFAEAFDGRDYAAINAYSFQGLRRDDPDEAPLVTPEVDYNLESEPGIAGGKYFLDSNVMNLNRIEGRDSRRLSLEGGWMLPHTSSVGLQTTLTASLRGDAYWTNGVNPGDPDPTPPSAQARDDDVAGRIFPQLGVETRYPFVRHSDSLSQIVEPVVQAVVGPDFGNPDDIPNEDSRDFVFDDTNLFSRNRFPGHDRIDTGQRIDYGLKYAVQPASGGYGEAFLGQSYRLDGGDAFPNGSGVGEGFSDLVGHATIEPPTDLSLSYRFRLDNDGLKSRRHEVDVRAGPKPLNVRLGYTFFDSTRDFRTREELRVRVTSQISQYWSVLAQHRHDLNANDPLLTQVALTYEDECFSISVIGERNFFRDRELEKEDRIFVRFSLKHLGVFGSEQVRNFRGP